MNQIELTKEHKADALRSLKEFFAKERDEEISDFQATLLLDFILQYIGPDIYNQAIADARAMLSRQLEELYGLEKRVFPTL